MSQKFLVRASLLPGQPFYSRAGRGWTNDPTLVEVLDQDECPKLPCRIKGLPDVADPNKLGRKAFEQLMKDPRISIKPEGFESAEALASQVPALQMELGKAKATIESLQSDLNVANKGNELLEAQLKSMASERDAARQSEATLEASVKGATKKRVAELEAKVAELEGMLADATKPSDPSAANRSAKG